MTGQQFILAIDQGTTSSRALLFDHDGAMVALAQRPIDVTFPHPGWVNQDARQLWSVTEAVSHEAMAQASVKFGQIAAIGITNQRETTILWERKTGEPLAPAVVWQSRQSADVIRAMERRGVGEKYRSITGLVLDPYFSASKIRWLFDQEPYLEARARR
ncbi:MAG TPA: FGGY family carbohydrate kinase, partial [Thermomicrobiales bacterium]|nr:FGGY family carbohydrate kinase [Thermomicrobiales bacterium]